MFLAKVGEAVMQGEKGGAEFFFLFVGQIAGIDAAQGLAFDELAQQLDDGEDELQEVRKAPRQAASASQVAPETTCGGRPRMGRPRPSTRPVWRASWSPPATTRTT